jgi:hypothetical protein
MARPSGPAVRRAVEPCVRIDTDSVVTSFSTATGGINGLLVQDQYVTAPTNLLFKNGFEASEP